MCVLVVNVFIVVVILDFTISSHSACNIKFLSHVYPYTKINCVAIAEIQATCIQLPAQLNLHLCPFLSLLPKAPARNHSLHVLDLFSLANDISGYFVFFSYLISRVNGAGL